jgi:hypothetical protein
MPAPSPSLARRLALPLGLSLLLHALVVAVAFLLPAAGPAPGESAIRTRGIPLCISVRLDGPGQRPRGPARTEPTKAPTDLDNAKLVFPSKAVSVHVESPVLPGPAASAGPGDGAGGQPGTAQAPAGPPSRGLLAVGGTARRIVYLVDRSISMGPTGALDAARAEVLASLRELPADARFQVIAYNMLAEPLMPGDLVPAEPARIDEAARRLAALRPEGGTHHVRALRRALLLLPTPEIIFLVTDAGDLTPADVRSLTYLNRDRRAAIHVIELGPSAADGTQSPLADLAAANAGNYRRVRPIP